MAASGSAEESSAKRSELRAGLERYRKDNRVVVAGVTGLLVVLVTLYYYLQRAQNVAPGYVVNKLLLFVLYYINFTLILVILFVLARNVVKLLLERKARILGSQFKTKLLLTYVGLSLLPVVLLFTVATDLLQRSIDRWFATPVAEILERGRQIADAYERQLEAQSSAFATNLKRVIVHQRLLEGESRELSNLLKLKHKEYRVDWIGLYHDGELAQSVVNPRLPLGEVRELSESFLAEVTVKGEVKKIDILSRGKLLRTAVAIRSNEDSWVVATGYFIPAEISERTDALIRAEQDFQQLAVQKGAIKTSHLLFFLLVTLLILFSSIWMGLYLARRITVPIQALAASTQRIAAGDLGHIVDVDAGDELGILVDSFNLMTRQLQAGKEQLERSNRDLTEGNLRLERERQYVQTVLDNVSTGILALDAAGHIFTLNASAARILGISESLAVGRDFHLVLGGTEHVRLAEILDDTLATGTNQAAQILLTAMGETRRLEVATTLMHAQGETVGLVAAVEDLTKLLNAQKVATWNEAAQRIAHEIKNPLTPIKLSAERISKRYAAGDPNFKEVLQEGTQTIMDAVASLKGLVDAFRRFARMPAVQLAATGLDEVVESTLHLYDGVRPDIRLSADLGLAGAQVLLDGEQFKRVLINLLDNAIEASASGGEIHVSTRRHDEQIEVEVADHGDGISLGDREKLFLPYFSTKGRGSGLGLAIVQRIVADHHGSIRVENNEPSGARFVIELPAA